MMERATHVLMKIMTEKEIRVKKKCREICLRNDKETSMKLIKEEFKGCAVDIAMHHGARGQKMTMGMIMWEDIDIMF